MRLLAALLRLLVGIPIIAVGATFGLGAVVLFCQGSELTTYGFVFLGLAFLFVVLGTWLLPRRQRRLSGDASLDRSWRDGAATEKQKSFARDLGIVFPKNITKGALSDLISEKTGK
jgi:hypothetical protein